MDLNYLLQRHQVSLMRTASAATGEARFAHRGLANAYADRIREIRAQLGATLPLLRTV